MSDQEVKFSLRVWINKEKTKVLFAEAGSDFADVLLSFLTLPLGTIVRILEKHYGEEAPFIGSLTTLYKGLANVDSVHFWTESGKQMLLNPRSSFEAECHKLKLNVDDTQPTKYFTCGDMECKRERSPNVSMYYDTTKCDCGKPLSKAMKAMESKIQADDGGGDGVFTEKTVSFLVTDDLQMVPNLPESIIKTLIDHGISISDGAELRDVTLGFNDIMDLLKGSLLSKTPLTDLIIHKRCRTNSVTANLKDQMMKEETLCNPIKKMTIKAFVQKSTNKLLFAQAEDDFVDFLFSLLIIPLGGAERLLASNTSLTSIDNLYKSVETCIDDKYLRTSNTKTRLIRPDLPPMYLTKNQVFPLSEQMTPNIYFFHSVSVSPNCTIEKGSWMRFNDPKGEGSYVKRPGNFVVTDDLEVRPLFRASTLSILKGLNISLSDLDVLDLHIGLKEALSILKASLTSTSALTDGLINHIYVKESTKARKLSLAP